MSSKKLASSKKCRQQDEEATAFAFQEFLQTFQNSSPMSKTFIQAGIYNPGAAASSTSNCNAAESSGKIYAPLPLHKKNYATQAATQAALECARLVKDDGAFKPPATMGNKPKSNLEALKEELQLRHQPQDNSKLPKAINSSSTFGSSPTATTRKLRDPDFDEMENTTNLFLTNLCFSLNEQDLMQIFGVYGPLASVKIMWPRVSHKGRSSNFGFVGFMSRKDCKRAYYALSTRGDMKISWGKPIDIPAQPIYIPPLMVKTMLPPPYSGLPFNAQDPRSIAKTPLKTSRKKHQEVELDWSVDLSKTHVKVTIPLDKKILFAIHRTIEFVVREGPLIEALIMQKESHNPVYQFLVDNKSAMHVYYRWKLYSILHGESISSWSTAPFRMFQGGAIWFPPIVPDYTKGMDLKFTSEEALRQGKRLLDSEQSSLIQSIQKLTPEKQKIAQVMVFCIDKMAAARDIVNIIADSFETYSCTGRRNVVCKTRGIKQIARLYLVSDILYNSKYRKCMEFIDSFKDKMAGVFEALSGTIEQYNLHMEHRFGSIVKLKILLVLRAWEMWRIFPKDTLKQLEDTLQFPSVAKSVIAIAKSPVVDEEEEKVVQHEQQQKMEPKTKLKLYLTPEIKVSKEKREGRQSQNADVTSKPTEIDVYATFIKSKWETQTPEVLQAQAMSTARLHEIEVQRRYEEELQKQQEIASSAVQQDLLNYDDLRKIEMKVIRYQDSLESGKKQFRFAQTLEGDVNEYRKRCIKKMKTKRTCETWLNANSIPTKKRCRR